MDFAEFLRIAEPRSGRIMWFLGAGCSQSAGVPTAYDFIWRFKRALYCSEERIPESRFSDLANPEVQEYVQGFFDARENYPPRDSPEEYAFYFERTYSGEGDRRRILDRALDGAAPSFGHYVLAAFMKEDLLRVVWTTNFDSLVEDAVHDLLGSGRRPTVADLDSAEIALDAINEERWPLIGKLHGDFRSKRLMNTAAELRDQEEELRDALIESCKRMGLAVVGYTGRDDSVMDSLEAVLAAGGRPFPFGLFWFHYGDGQPYERVTRLLEEARAQGVEAKLLRVGVFDELMGDMISAFPQALRTLDERDISPSRRLAPAPIPTPGNMWPIIRTNALPLESWPGSARLVNCDIGGIREVREAIDAADADVLATRRYMGVVAFGRDEEITRTLAPFDITGCDLHALNLDTSSELGLVYDALAKALGRERPVRNVRAGSRQFLTADPDRLNERVYEKLKAAVGGSLTGTISGTSLQWWEAVALRPEYRHGKFWLLIEPTIFTEGTEDDDLRSRAKGFVTNRLADRYNSTWNELFDAWTVLICGGRQEVEVAGFGISDGVDARYKIVGKTAYSRRHD